jgi:predicted nicotinamide N-methyase
MADLRKTQGFSHELPVTLAFNPTVPDAAQTPPVTPLTARHFARFLAKATNVVRPPLCPEIRLRVASNLESLWRAQERWFRRVGMAPPYWAIPWPGGQALARFVLDNPERVRGRSVLDLGAGSGLCGIAAAMSGATVTAADIDTGASFAIAANAELNCVQVSVTTDDPLCSTRGWDVVLAADLWYERFMADRVTGWLRVLAAAGTQVLLGDVGRAYFPRAGPKPLGSYLIDATTAAERQAGIEAHVWQFQPLPSPLGSSSHVAISAHQPCSERMVPVDVQRATLC